MRAEILSIGSEMTSGQNFDTNGPWLSRALAEVGIATAFRTTIGDDPEDNRQVFEAASKRADVVISTGGLGPTQDDLTREILARLAGVELVFHEESWRKIQEMFTQRNRICPDRNRVQAMAPACAEMLD
ncbi:MAG: competence/damage-inducible protein A, partial [Gemmataceae bacterium]